MIKIITSRTYNELIQQLNGLRSVNDSKDHKIKDLKSEINIKNQHIDFLNGELKNQRLKVNSLESEIKSVTK